MTTSHDTQTISVSSPDGRPIAVDIVGPAEAPAVVLLHPAPGSRRFDPDPEATAAAGVRLITFDRPGYGASASFPGGYTTIPGLADDAVTVLDALGVGEATFVGWSAGGRIAAAVAARAPERVRALAIVATPAPHEAVPWIPDEHAAMIPMMQADPLAGVAMLATVFDELAHDDDAAIASVAGTDADRDALVDVALRDRIAAMVREAFAPGARGTALDIVSYTAVDWGFDPRAIGAPTVCMYGDADTLTPPAHGEWWADQIADATEVTVPGAGHLVIASQWAAMLDRLGVRAG